MQCGPGECCTAGVCEQQRLVSHGGPGGGDQAGAGLSRVCLGFSSAPPAQAQGCGPAPAPLPRPPSLVFSPSFTHSHSLALEREREREGEREGRKGVGGAVIAYGTATQRTPNPLPGDARQEVREACSREVCRERDVPAHPCSALTLSQGRPFNWD